MEQRDAYRVVAIIQARMGSSRLPDKVMLDIAGKPMLRWVVERAQQAKTVDQVVVATTLDPADDAVAIFCETEGIACTRGSLHDVLDRYYQAARQTQADILVRLTADCPLLDPDLVDQTVLALWDDSSLTAGEPFLKSQAPVYDFTANRLPPPWGRTYPIGLDVEACTMAALEAAWNQAASKHHREHVMPYLYENSDRFRVFLLNHDQDYGSLRWTVDTPQDLDLVRKLADRLPENNRFSWLDVLKVFESDPALAAINQDVYHKDYREVDDRAV